MDSLLRALVDLRDRQIQKARIQFSNRLDALARDADTDPDGRQSIIISRYLDTFKSIENDLDNDIVLLCEGIPIVDHLIALKGISYTLAAKLVAMIDPARAPTISSLWRYAGFGVVDGHREKSVKGEKRHYNGRLKTACYLIGTSFLRCNSPYRSEYDKAREKYEGAHPDWTPLHQHYAAMGNMIKLFLCYSPDTQVLTDSGLKYVSEIRTGERIATLNPKSQMFEWQPVTETYAYQYDGDLVHFYSESFDFLVTPNHRMWTRPVSRYGGWQFREARHFADGTSPRQEIAALARECGREAAISQGVPETTARRWAEDQGRPHGTAPISWEFKTDSSGWIGTDIHDVTDNWLTFIGWWLAEGSKSYNPKWPGGYDVRITQKDRVVLEKLAKVAEALGYNPHIYDHSSTPQLSISSKDLYERLDLYGDRATNKQIPQQLKDLPTDRLRILFDAMMKGDGTRRADGHYHRYSTVSPWLACDVAEMALKLGYGTRIRRTPRDLPHHDLYSISIRTHRITPQICNPVRREPYAGDVYCVTVPNHILLAGRDGKLAWCGNSHLWLTWRTLEGLPTRPPYVQEYMGHTSISRPEDYGWPSGALAGALAGALPRTPSKELEITLQKGESEQS